MKTHTFKIKGMGSNHCVGVVTNIIRNLQGAHIEKIEIGKAVVSIDEDIITKEKVIAAIEKMGYKIEN
jgi:copper chaperone CopZ